MNTSEFLNPADMQELWDPVTEAYGNAFGDLNGPWKEVTKCADTKEPARCESGFSPLAIGERCLKCCQQLTQPAYDRQELVDRFEALAATRPTQWYIEGVDGRLAMAALAWRADAATIAAEKYQSSPTMRKWLTDNVSGEVGWLDEAFADPSVRPTGNLRNFGECIRGLAESLGVSKIMYRTVEEKMEIAALRDFGDRAAILRRRDDVPDWRDFIIIDLNGEV